MQANIKEEYLRAMRMGQKEKKELEAAGRDPFPAVLEDVCPGIARSSVTELPVQEIPADRIIGIRSRGRISAFSASFLPLPEPGSEFASKWMALCEAHLSDTGIREPVLCYEYLGSFYVQEGNKRVSVLKYFGAVRIPSRVLRVLPADRSTPEAAAYYEFLDFYRDTGLYDVQFRSPGSYAKLYAALGKKPGDPWTDTERKHFASVFRGFREAFDALGGAKRGMSAEDALLLFLRVHPYDRLEAMDAATLRKALSALWGDIEASAAGNESVTFGAPGAAEKKTVIGKLISGAPDHLTAAFLYPRDPETFMWTRAHAQAAASLEAVFGGAVTVKHFFHADTAADAEHLIDDAAADGADLIFTTTPPLLGVTLREAVRYPKIRFFNCSPARPLSSVRTYYCRAYEGKFITGLIAGAMAENGLIGYVGSYPILGVPASVNAFAAGARMTNPRAKILLEWSCLGGDSVGRLAERGARVISNRDVPLADPHCMDRGEFGLFRIGENGHPEPLASPCWMWSKLYENILRPALDGAADKKDHAVSYWWGMDSGAMDVLYTDRVPAAVRALAEAMADRVRGGAGDPFRLPLTAKDGSVLTDGSRALTPMEILHMDRLADVVDGRIPDYGELQPVSRELVRELGIYADSIPADPEEEGSGT